MKQTILAIACILCSIAGFSQMPSNMQMISVKGGSFFMGSDDPKYRGEQYENERPVRRVHVSSFFIGKYEVTQAQWRKVMGINPPAYNGVDYGNKFCDECPVVKISWDDVQEFIKRLNAKTGKTYRLPTETEWEYAARGGKYPKNFLFSGGNKMAEVGWNGKKNGTTHPVGQKICNEVGVFDMSGNVLEWCSDWYGADYYSGTVDETDPKGPMTGAQRVLRGGSFFDDDDVCRSTYRSHMDPGTRQWNIGFRLAMDDAQ